MCGVCLCMCVCVCLCEFVGGLGWKCVYITECIADMFTDTSFYQMCVSVCGVGGCVSVCLCECVGGLGGWKCVYIAECIADMFTDTSLY